VRALLTFHDYDYSQCFGSLIHLFIVENMCVLQVLDLENTYGLGYHGLDHIVKLVHLRYLSQQGYGDIVLLPDLLGNLRHLQMLNISHTYIIALLIKSIIKLQKLQYIHTGNKS
jgi:hypothetical protein